MIFFEIPNYKIHLKDDYRLLSFDVGTVRVGAALSDCGKILATPYNTFNLKKQKFNIALLKDIIEQEHIYGIVVGNPLQMDGEAGGACEMVDKFIKKYLLPLGQPIFMQDERLSTVAVNRFLKEKGYSRIKQEQVNDQESASYILQIVLDKLRS